MLNSEFEQDSSFCKKVGVFAVFCDCDFRPLPAFDDLVSVLFGVAYESFDADSLNVSSNSLVGNDCSSNVSVMMVAGPCLVFFGLRVLADLVVFGVDSHGTGVSALSFRYLIVIFCGLADPFSKTIVDASICSSISST